MSPKERSSNGLTAILATAHAVGCPAHGVVPALAKLNVGGTLAGTDGVLQPLAELHEAEVKGVDYVLKKIDPPKKVKQFGAAKYQMLQQEPLHPHAEMVVSGVSYLFLAMSAYALRHKVNKTIYNVAEKIYGGKNEKITSNRPFGISWKRKNNTTQSHSYQ